MNRPDLFRVIPRKNLLGNVRDTKDVTFVAHDTSEWIPPEDPYIAKSTQGVPLLTAESLHGPLQVDNPKDYREFMCFKLDHSVQLPVCLQCIKCNTWVLAWNDSVPRKLENTDITHDVEWSTGVVPEIADLPWQDSGKQYVARGYQLEHTDYQLRIVLTVLESVIHYTNDFVAAVTASKLWYEIKDLHGVIEITQDQAKACRDLMSEIICWAWYPDDVHMAHTAMDILYKVKRQ